MIRINKRVSTVVCSSIVISCTAGPSAQSAQQLRLAYFEGGQYPVHSILREEFTRQLIAVLPENYEVAFVPEGYQSAGWKRDSCRIMAKQLAAVPDIDLVIAMGPWVVEDLLEAGFTRPILAMHQFDPVAQGLVGDDGRPVAPNLTVQVKPGRIEDDLRTLARLVDVKKLAVLYFQSGDEGGEVISAINSVGKALGFEVSTSEGFDNYGTYAFFKAYHGLDKKVDALYLPPMWGMDDIKVGEFLSMVTRDEIPTFTSEGRYLVERGAFGSSTAYSIASDARYNAAKAARILQGELPASLPVGFKGGAALALNEQTAQLCSITLPTEAINSAYLVAAPVSETTPYYALPDAVERTLSYNPGYLARYDALEEAIQAAKQAYSSYLPQIVARASLTHIDDNAVYNSRGVFENDRYRSTLRVHQTIFSAETIKSIQLAARRKNLEQINLQQAKLDLELAVTAAYLNYLGAREILEAQRQFRALVDRNLEIAGARFLVEEGSEIDLLRWKDERHKATLRVIHAKSDLEVAGVLVNVLFNLPGNSPIAVDTLSFSEDRFWSDYDQLYSAVPTVESQRLLGDVLVAEGLQRNPVMQSLDVDIAIQRDLLSKNRTRYYPALDFRASVDYADQLADYPPTFVEKNTTWSVWGGLTLPVFLGTDRIRERARLKARLSQAEFEKDAAGLEVMGRISTGTYDLVAQVNSLPRAIRSAELAMENLRLVVDKYDAGKLGLVDLVDALDNARDSKLNSITARCTFYLSMAQLVHDIGLSGYDSNTTFREQFFRRLSEHSVN